MGRKPRTEFPGALLHVWARRVDRRLLFVDDDDYQVYTARLGAAVAEFEWILPSFCLMPNHLHLLVKLREPNLGVGMQKLHRAYATWFNNRHDRTGRLFEHRYGAKLVRDDLYFWTVVRYIEANPVDAGLCTRPEEWPWCSRALLARKPPPDWVTEPKDATWYRL